MASARSLLWVGVVLALIGALSCVLSYRADDWWLCADGWTCYTPYSLRVPFTLAELMSYLDPIVACGLVAVAWGRAALEQRWWQWPAVALLFAAVMYGPPWLDVVGPATFALTLVWPRTTRLVVGLVAASAFVVGYFVRPDHPAVLLEVVGYVLLAGLMFSAARDEPAGASAAVPTNLVALVLLVLAALAFVPVQATMPAVGTALSLGAVILLRLGARPHPWLDAALGLGLVAVINLATGGSALEPTLIKHLVAPLMVPMAAVALGRSGWWLVVLGLVPPLLMLAILAGWA